MADPAAFDEVDSASIEVKPGESAKKAPKTGYDLTEAAIEITDDPESVSIYDIDGVRTPYMGARSHDNAMWTYYGATNPSDVEQWKDSSNKWRRSYFYYRRLAAAHYLRIEASYLSKALKEAESSSDFKRSLNHIVIRGTRRKSSIVGYDPDTLEPIVEVEDIPVERTEDVLKTSDKDGKDYIYFGHVKFNTGSTKGVSGPSIGLGTSTMRGTDIMGEDAMAVGWQGLDTSRIGIPSLQRRVMYRTAALALWMKTHANLDLMQDGLGANDFVAMRAQVVNKDAPDYVIPGSPLVAGDANVADIDKLNDNFLINPLARVVPPPAGEDIHPAEVLALSYLAHAAMLVTGYRAPFVNDNKSHFLGDHSDEVQRARVDSVTGMLMLDPEGAYVLPSRATEAIAISDDEPIHPSLAGKLFPAGEDWRWRQRELYLHNPFHPDIRHDASRPFYLEWAEPLDGGAIDPDEHIVSLYARPEVKKEEGEGEEEVAPSPEVIQGIGFGDCMNAQRTPENDSELSVAVDPDLNQVPDPNDLEYTARGQSVAYKYDIDGDGDVDADDLYGSDGTRNMAAYMLGLDKGELPQAPFTEADFEEGKRKGYRYDQVLDHPDKYFALQFKAGPNPEPIRARRMLGPILNDFPAPYADQGAFDMAGQKMYNWQDYDYFPLDMNDEGNDNISDDLTDTLVLDSMTNFNVPTMAVIPPQWTYTNDTDLAESARAPANAPSEGMDSVWARNAYETMQLWVAAYTAAHPHCRIIPKPLNQSSLAHFGIYQQDLFSGSGSAASALRSDSGVMAPPITFTGDDFRVGGRENSVPVNPDLAIINAENWRKNKMGGGALLPNFGNPSNVLIQHERFGARTGIGFPFGIHANLDSGFTSQARWRSWLSYLHGHSANSYAGDIVNDAAWGMAEDGATIDEDHAAANPDRFTLQYHFDAADRTRQLVFWHVNWHAYADSETVPSARIDLSHYGRYGSTFKTRNGSFVIYQDSRPIRISADPEKGLIPEPFRKPDLYQVGQKVICYFDSLVDLGTPSTIVGIGSSDGILKTSILRNQQ